MSEESITEEERANAADEWAVYELDFDPTQLSKDAQWWLRSYLKSKSHRKGEDEKFQVLRCATKIFGESNLGVASAYSKEQLLEYLWCLTEIYQKIPDVPLVNELYGKFSLPAYTRILPKLGSDKEWRDQLKNLALTKDIMAKFYESVFHEEFSAESVGNDRMLNNSNQVNGGLDADRAVLDATKQADMGEASSLRQDLKQCLPQWSSDLVEWLAKIIESLRAQKMDEKHERWLMDFLAKPKKDSWDYALIAALELPSLQFCLLRPMLEEFSNRQVQQLTLDLIMVYGEVPRLKEELLRGAMELGLPPAKCYTEALGARHRSWQTRLNNAVENNEIIRHCLSDFAIRVAKQDYLERPTYCTRQGVITHYQQEGNTLVMMVKFADGQYERLVLDIQVERRRTVG